MILKHNQKGGVLLTVIMGLAVVGAAGYYIMNVRGNAERANSRTKYENDLALIVNDIQVQLSNTRKCVNTLTPNLLPKSIVSKLDNVGATVTRKYYLQTEAQGKKGYTDSEIKIARFRLDETPKVPPRPPEFIIEFVNKEVFKGGGKNNLVTVRKIPMFIQKTGLAVTKCRSISNGDMEIWERSPAALNNIYYNDGWVGVGRRAPLASVPPALPIMPSRLHVEKQAIDQLPASPKFNDPAMRATGMVLANKFYYISDQRLKKNIVEIKDPLGLISSLHGIGFNWRESKKHDYGFIAQEVESILPQLVQKGNETDTLKVEYVKVVPILVEAVKAQEAQIKSLKKRLLNLQNK